MSRKRLAFLVMALFMTMIVFSGCGGGGGGGEKSSGKVGETLYGVFIDGPVEGLRYECTPSGLSGTTNSNGAFSYKAGDKIAFYIGSIALPEIPAANIIYPLSYFDESATIEDDEVLNFVRLIMSAGDVGADGKIKIRTNPFNGMTGTFPEIWDTLVSSNAITVSNTAAKAHVEKSLLVAYAGAYSGTWEGVNTGYGASVQIKGSWTITITENGSVNGSYTGTGLPVPIAGSVTGYISADGNAILDASGQAGDVVVWTGKINLVTGNMRGTYVGTYDVGTFTGERK